ncbi:MAG: riboflavin biosynthesis protein RibF [bacterium]|nr:riboflavin biosynthesis protein RibF [bacterium]
MQIWYSIEEYRESSVKRPFVTMGVFDGVHRGHRTLTTTLLAQAKADNATPIALTFDVHPESFTDKEPPSLLNYSSEKLARLSELSLAGILVLEFSERMRDIGPEEFVKRYLSDELGIAGIVAGYDTRFGRGQRGDVELLKDFAERYGFSVVTAPALKADGLVISSTVIRETLRKGEVTRAADYLGYNYELTGTVIAGKGVGGATLGYPTANLTARPKLVPGFGVYAAYVYPPGDESPPERYGAFLNIGVRPTFDDGSGPSIEVHLFGFSGDLLGRELRIEFVRRLRDEMKFDGPDELRKQLEEDAARAREVLGKSEANGYLIY